MRRVYRRVYAAKALDALEGGYARGSAGDGFYHPRRLPHGECGVWGRAPGFLTGVLQRVIAQVRSVVSPISMHSW